LKTAGTVADARSHNSKKAILDMGAKYEVQSMWNKKWGHPELNSVTGFHIGHKEVKTNADFWVMIDFDKLTEVTQVLLKKRADYFKHSDWKLTNRVIHKIKIEYNDGENWVQYKDGAHIATGQTKLDEAEKVREINLIPFNATKVKVHFPRSERNNQWCDGRIDLLVTGAEGQNSLAETKDPSAAKKALGEVGATSLSSSSWKKNTAVYEGAGNVKLNSVNSFHNEESEFSKDFWIVVDFPKTDFYEVTSLIMKKRIFSGTDEKTIDGVTVEYYDGKDWVSYMNGDVMKLGQLPADDSDVERTISFEPSFTAQKVRVTIPRK